MPMISLFDRNMSETCPLIFVKICNMPSIEIPVDSQIHALQVEGTLKKMHFQYSEVLFKRKIIGFVIVYQEPIELFYLGATAVADACGIFKSGIII